MCNFSVVTVPADGLAPLGARASAGTVMTVTWRTKQKLLKKHTFYIPILLSHPVIPKYVLSTVPSAIYICIIILTLFSPGRCRRFHSLLAQPANNPPLVMF